jgi:ATP-dependent helicase Lhr and Lhr-like helicase
VTVAAPEAFDRLHPVLQHHIVNTLGWPALRPLQGEAVAPLLAGDDAVLLAPTAGGKTEAALFPLLTRMEEEQWPGLSLLYVCPLKALLNNLHPRVEQYGGWLGRRVDVRHGDVGVGARRRQALERPSVLLTTPESIEAMLVSPTVDAPRMFGDVRAVVIDEVHAFAGDDRGWHLLAVLERVAELAGGPVQRVGLSATVGNPQELLRWLQGRGAGRRPATVVAPEVNQAGVVPDMVLDFVGNESNAALVLSRMHAGEKRLVFADSRRVVEALSVRLRENGVETFTSHSSLALDERRRAEAAFAEARDCVIVSTSTLELGIDVGDLDRVIQIGAPNSVASLLQRLGRTGRRPGTTRNMTFLALKDQDFLRAAGLLLLWAEGYVEPVIPPPQPRHVAAQQFLGLALQKGHVDVAGESEWMTELGLASEQDLVDVADWLVKSGHLDVDSGLAFVGPEAERRYGARNFMEVLAVFAAAPEVMVLHGRVEIGTVDPLFLTTKIDGPRIIVLAGRRWQVVHIDWRRRRAFVEPHDHGGAIKWNGDALPYSFALSDAVRRVLLGADPGQVTQSRRAAERLAALREEYAPYVDPVSTVVAQDTTRSRWWTFAGARANAVLTAALDAVAPALVEGTVVDNFSVPLRGDAQIRDLVDALAAVRERFQADLSGILPEVSDKALKKLKFAELLPPHLALSTLATRAADYEGAAARSSTSVQLLRS